MKNLFVSSLLVFSLALGSNLRADEFSDSYMEEETFADDPLAYEQSEPAFEEETDNPHQPTQEGQDSQGATQGATQEDTEEGTQVGQGASSGMDAAKRRQWQNIAIAAAAIAVTITALVLISTNGGHHSSGNKSSNPTP